MLLNIEISFTPSCLAFIYTVMNKQPQNLFTLNQLVAGLSNTDILPLPQVSKFPKFSILHSPLLT